MRRVLVFNNEAGSVALIVRCEIRATAIVLLVVDALSRRKPEEA